jgi:alpha-beta hydrolase superfamily lysophospholipase
VQPRLVWRARRPIVILAALFLFGTIAINGVAFMQARAMTHFVASGSTTAPPESLSRFQKLKILLIGIQMQRPENRSTPESIGLDFQTVRFGGPHNDDCEAWLIPSAASGGLCIEFHGYEASKSSLLEAARAFHDLRYDVLAVDFRGYGGSRGNETTIGYREADDVAAAVKFASELRPAEPVILYGQSMGGAAILRAVAQLNVHPAAIIIESTFDRLLRAVDNRFNAMGIPAFPLANLLVFWGGLEQGHNGFRHNPADYAMNVHCPVLLFQGGRDPRVTNSQAQNLFAHLAGPKQMDLFDSAGHCGFLANDRERWNFVVKTFLMKWIPPR